MLQVLVSTLNLNSWKQMWVWRRLMPGLLRFVADPLICCSSFAGYSLV